MKHFRLILVFILFVLQSCGLLMVGSYPCAEYYQFIMPMDELIEKTNAFKEENPIYKFFSYNEKNEEEILDGYGEYFYHLYFYFEDIDQKVHCVIKKGDNSHSCRIGLVSMSESNIILGGWKSINTKDLSKEENEAIKKKFETEILDKLGEWKRCK